MVGREGGYQSMTFDECMTPSIRKQAYNLAYSYLFNREDSEDAVIHACENAWKYFDRYNPDWPFVNWFLRIVKHSSIDIQRFKAVRLTPVSLDDKKRDAIIPSEEQEPFHVLTQGQMDEELEYNLSALPDRYRIPITLVHLEDMSYKEAAAKMGTPIGTLRSRISRGVSIMRERMIS
jgi:RNA polymerase sigma-70 factor, ECF subfamily